MKDFLPFLFEKMAEAVIASEEMGVMLRTLAEDLKSLFGADHCCITEWNNELQRSILLCTTAGEYAASPDMEFVESQLAITQSVVRHGRALIAEDVCNSPYLSPEAASRFPAQSLLGLPLIHREKKLGAILLTYHTPHKFSEEEVRQGERAAKQLSIVIWNARQEFELQKRLKEADALNRISLALTQGERVGLSNLLNLIATSAKDLISGAEQAIIHLLDEDGQSLSPKAAANVHDLGEKGNKIRLGEGVAGRVLASGETLNLADVNTDERFIKIGAPPTFRSLMVAPIQSGENPFGTISVHSKKPNAFSTDEQRLLSLLGVEAAIAIENARLLETAQQGLKEINALYHLTRKLASSLDPVELMRDVVETLYENFGYYHVQIYMLDDATGDLVIAQAMGEMGRRLMAEKHRIPAGQGITGHVVATGQPFLTNDVANIPFYLPNPFLPDVHSELCVPIKIHERVVGVLNVERDANSSRITGHDLQLVTAVAEQLSVALQKADLYTNLQTSLQEEKRMRAQLVQSERLAMMGKLLASVAHELNNPLQAIQNALFLLKTEQGLSPQGRQDLEIILSEAERMAIMIERLRATYRPIQAEDFRPMQINTIVEDVYALVATHFKHREISFEFHPDPDLPAIPGLPDQIRQVILNLFMNAADAMNGQGRVSVSTRYLPDTEEVFISVTDDGAGIDPAILPNIFDAFITNKPHGTGLGLTICYDIVVKHKGRITAENNPDKGATFTIWLPAGRRDTS